MLHGACQFLIVLYVVRIFPYYENVQFKRIKINNISYEIKISYEGHFVKVEIKFKKFLTILSPNMDDQR